MPKLRYPILAVLFTVMTISSCQCQCGKTRPPGVEEGKAPDASAFDAPKPMLSDALPPTPAQRPEAEPEPEVAEAPDLPEDFPEDIPVLEDSEVAQVQQLANAAKNVIFVTGEPVAKITPMYRKKMEDQGWKITQDFERGNHAFIGFKRGNMIANIQVAEDPRYPGKLLVAIMYEEEKPLPFPEF